MSRRLLPNKKFWKNSKGISGILATIFMVLTVLFLYAHVFVFIQNENRRFEESIREVNQMDMDYSSEKITISNVIYTVVGDQVHVQAKVTNDGTVAVQIITLWTVDKTIQKFGYNDTLEIDLNIGDTLNFAESNALIVTIEGSESSHKFTSWFITARGNLIPLEKESEEEAPPSVQAFGVFSLDWFIFNYASETYPAPRTAGAISKTEDYISFFVKVTNNYNETMTIQSSSMLMLLIEWQEPLFYIVEEANYAKWRNTNWDFPNSPVHTGSYSAHAGSSDTTLTSMDLDASDATNITVSFWYRDDDIDSGDADLQFWDGSTYDPIFDLGNTDPEDTWHYYTVTTSDPQYLISDFHIRFDAAGLDSGFGWSENLWIDDVVITKNTGGGEVTLLSDGFEDVRPGTSPSLTAYDDANPITVAPRSSATLAFAAATAGATSWAWGSSPPTGVQNGNTPEGAVAMVALVFTMESKPTKIQAQSLPFRALVLN